MIQCHCHNALLEREHPAVGVEGEREVVLDAEAEEDVLQRRAPSLVRLGEGDLSKATNVSTGWAI